MRKELHLLVLALPASLAGQEGMFRGDAARRGVFAGVAVERFGGVQWRVQTDGPVRSSPAVAGGVVYVGSSDGAVYAIDASGGTVRWRTTIRTAISSSPAIGGGLVYVHGHDGVLYALDAATGRVRWQYATGREVPLAWGLESGLLFDSSPVVAGGVVLVGGRDGRLHAVDARTGRVRWRAGATGRLYSSPAVAHGVVYAGSQDGYVHAWSLADGRARWRFATHGASLRSSEYGFDRTTVQSSPTVVDGAVYVGARDGFLYSIDAATGRERWRMDHKVSWVNSSPAVDGGLVYAASSDGHFIQAVDARTGQERWRAPTIGVVWASPSVDRSLVYVGEANGTLYALDKRTGSERWRWRAGARVFSSVALREGSLYVGSDDGGVYALSAASGPALRRAVFWDSAYAGTPFTTNRAALLAWLAERGYEVLNASALASFLSARVLDREPSVVVFAMDHLPAPVAPVASDTVLFRRYLDAGGSVVWCGTPPLLAPAGAKGLKDLVRAAPAALLGVRFDRANFDAVGVARVTPRARHMGLPAWWLDSWGADTTGLEHVLAIDEMGQAVAWTKRYGSPPGTGFTRVPCMDGAAGRPFTHLAVQVAAEWRGR
jgi:outer membrane protein assembly factor BamB